MRKKLFLLTTSYPYEKGETFIENEIKYLEKAFDEILILCSSENNESTNRYVPANTEVRYIPSNNITVFDKLFSLKGLLTLLFWREILAVKSKLNVKSFAVMVKTLLIELYKAKKSSCILKKIASTIPADHKLFFYSYWLNYNAIALALIKKKFPESILCSRAHRWDLYAEVNPNNYLPLRNYLYKNLDAIFPISFDGLSYISSTYKKTDSEKGARLILSKLGTTYHGKNPVTSDKENECIIVSCSQIYPNKQVDLIAKTLINSRLTISVKWFHFGSPMADSSDLYYHELLDVVNNNTNRNIEIHLMGYTTNDKIMEFYLNNPVDVFMNLSLSEGIPVSIMEAMSFGIPVIATAVGGTPEIVEDKITGYLLSQHPTPEEVIHALITFVSLTGDQKAMMRQKSYETWNQKYNADTNYNVFVEQLLNL